MFQPHNPRGVVHLEGEMDGCMTAWADPTADVEFYPIYVLSPSPATPEEGGEWTTVTWDEGGEQQSMLINAGPLGVWGLHKTHGIGEIPPDDLVMYFADSAAQWVSLRSRREDVQALLAVRDLWEAQQRRLLPSWFTALELLLDLVTLGGDHLFRRSAERCQLCTTVGLLIRGHPCWDDHRRAAILMAPEEPMTATRADLY